MSSTDMLGSAIMAASPRAAAAAASASVPRSLSRFDHKNDCSVTCSGKGVQFQQPVVLLLKPVNDCMQDCSDLNPGHQACLLQLSPLRALSACVAAACAQPAAPRQSH